MNQYIAKRNFAKSQSSGMVYRGDILTDLPEEYVSSWTALGIIEPYTGTGDQLPDEVTTSTMPLRKPTGKPGKDTKRK